MNIENDCFDWHLLISMKQQQKKWIRSENHSSRQKSNVYQINGRKFSVDWIIAGMSFQSFELGYDICL